MKEKKKVTRTANLKVARVVRDQIQDPIQILGGPDQGPTGLVPDLAEVLAGVLAGVLRVEHNHQNPRDSYEVKGPLRIGEHS